MDNSSNFYDYKVFIKKNLNIIISTTIVVFVALLSTVLFFITRTEEVIDDNQVIEQILPEIESSTDVDQLSKSNQELLTDYLNKGSYSFRIYVENEDGSVFTDNELLKQILLDKQLTQTIIEQTNTEFIPTRELAVSVFTVRGSEMIQIKVGTGNTEYNQTIANFYYEFIENNNISLFEDKEVYFIDSAPIVFEEIYGIIEENEEIEFTFQQKINENLEVIIIVSLVGILGGLILGTLISVIKETVSNKIPSIYNFDLWSKSTIINLDSIVKQTTDDVDAIIIQSIVAENKNNKLILSEEPMDTAFSNKLIKSVSESNTQYHINVANMESIPLDNVEEIIILVQIYKTSKQWFEKQMEQVKALTIPVKIIRLPNDNDLFKEN